MNRLDGRLTHDHVACEVVQKCAEDAILLQLEPFSLGLAEARVAIDEVGRLPIIRLKSGSNGICAKQLAAQSLPTTRFVYTISTSPSLLFKPNVAIQKSKNPLTY